MALIRAFGILGLVSIARRCTHVHLTCICIQQQTAVHMLAGWTSCSQAYMRDQSIERPDPSDQRYVEQRAMFRGSTTVDAGNRPEFSCQSSIVFAHELDETNVTMFLCQKRQNHTAFVSSRPSSKPPAMWKPPRMKVASCYDYVVYSPHSSAPHQMHLCILTRH